MSKYRLSKRADQDLIDIYLYTLEKFGTVKADEYTVNIKRCFEILSDNPRMGRAADNIRQGSRRHEHSGHVIFYREDGSGILIQAVIHRRMRPDLAGEIEQ